MPRAFGFDDFELAFPVQAGLERGEHAQHEADGGNHLFYVASVAQQRNFLMRTRRPSR
jgi:hypothetical protein